MRTKTEIEKGMRVAILPIVQRLYGASSGVIDLGAEVIEIIPQADLRTNTGYLLDILVNNCPSSLIGTLFGNDVAGLAFANQPANDSVTVRTNSASDVGKTAYIYGTTNATNYVLLGQKTIAAANTDEDIALPSGTAKTDWGEVLGVELSSAAVGTITFKEKSGGLTIATIAAAASSSGVTAVAAASGKCYGLPVKAAGSDTTTKKVGIVGTNDADVEIYDAITLSNTTAVAGAVGFDLVTKLLTGDLESNRTADFMISNLTFGAGAATMENLGAADDGFGRRLGPGYRYLHWALVSSITASAGGINDRLKIIRYR